MSDLEEVYSSSDSQLSSDEYSHGEDDDALMDAAVTSQKSENEKTPRKPAKKSSGSNYTSPAKSSSTTSSSSTLSKKRNANKPRRMRANPKFVPPKKYFIFSKFRMYFKRRSSIWLVSKVKSDYLNRLKEVLPVYKERAKRMEAFRAKRRAIELELEMRQRRVERTPSRSHSPELICLDDTENEESPEKPTPTPKAAQKAAVNLLIPPRDQAAVKPAIPLAENGMSTVTSTTTITTNTSMTVLEEFLTLRTETAAPPAPENCLEVAGPAPAAPTPAALSESLVREVLEKQKEVMSFINAVVAPPEPEPTLKRRRSVSPPPEPVAVVESLSDLIPEVVSDTIKRTKLPSPPAKEVAVAPPADEDIIELMPNDIPEKPAPQPALVEPPSNALPAFKLGAAFSLPPSAVESVFQAAAAVLPSPKIMQELPANMSFSLDTPPAVEAMEISYPSEKPASNFVQSSPYNEPNYAKRAPATPNQIQMQMPVQQLQPTPTPVALNAVFNPPAAPVTPAQKPRVEHISRQTQTAQPPKAPSSGTNSVPSSAPGTNKSTAADLNNSDAAFHQRVKELYTELDQIMTDKVRSVRPELKSYGEEKIRIEADIKTLDNLIAQKEEEHNRLLHLRCVKEELYARIERKERLLIMKEIIPTIISKNCSTSELYEMSALLLKEQNAPMPPRLGQSKSVMEEFVNRLERNQDDLKLWRSALNLQGSQNSSRNATVAPPPPPAEHQRRISMPSMRLLQPQTATNVSAAASGSFGRQGAVRDVRSLIEDFRREHPEEQPLVGKRAKLQIPPSRYQLLLNDTKQLSNSTANLSANAAHSSNASPTYAAQLGQRNHLENHLESTPKPLFNSSPFQGVRQHTHRHSEGNAFNHTHSNFPSNSELELRNLWQELRHSRLDMTEKLRAAVNGPPEETRERPCQYCKRYEATYTCAGCQNQWYCSRECQLHDWDTHWESCST